LKASRENRDTAERILDIAEELLRVRGFNAFSYADVAAELGITKASLHYHFPGKGELGQALVSRYSVRFALALAEIDSETDDAAAKLAAYADLYADAFRGRGMCLCGMLAAEYETLPEPMRDSVVAFFDENEVWLAGVLEHGRAQDTLEFERSARDTARMIISTLEGAMLVTRPYGEVSRFQAAATALLAGLAVGESPADGPGRRGSRRRMGLGAGGVAG
jgi:TetR/AcrR family transcriptional regulator, transcriptional repressor for nem operon